MIFLKLGGSAITDDGRSDGTRRRDPSRGTRNQTSAGCFTKSRAWLLIGHSSVDGFAMGFAANLHAVDLNPGMIHPLLKQARAIFDAATPPARREGCVDCARVDELIATARTR